VRASHLDLFEQPGIRVFQQPVNFLVRAGFNRAGTEADRPTLKRGVALSDWAQLFHVISIRTSQRWCSQSRLRGGKSFFVDFVEQAVIGVGELTPWNGGSNNA
jgi:hypothetical protein